MKQGRSKGAPQYISLHNYCYLAYLSATARVSTHNRTLRSGVALTTDCIAGKQQKLSLSVPPLLILLLPFTYLNAKVSPDSRVQWGGAGNRDCVAGKEQRCSSVSLHTYCYLAYLSATARVSTHKRALQSAVALTTDCIEGKEQKMSLSVPPLLILLLPFTYLNAKSQP